MVIRFSPAEAQIFLPTSGLPVKLILRMRGSRQIASPSFDPLPVTQAMESSGSPASSKISVRLSADKGVSLAGLISTALPAAIAGPTLWQTRLRGKLKGVIAATTPQGIRIVNPSLCSPPRVASSGITSP